jgi:hypothetical protein
MTLCRFCHEPITRPTRKVFCTTKCRYEWANESRRIANRLAGKSPRAGRDGRDLSARAIEARFQAAKAWQRYERAIGAA